MSEVRPPPPADHTSSSGEIKIQLHQLGAGQTQQDFEFQQPQSVPDPGLGGHLVGSSDLQLQLRRMELEFEERQKQRQHEYEMRKLELKSSRLTLSASASSQPPPFQVDAAVKLIPKFTEYDVETFLISFEKIAKLKAFSPDEYAAVLQAHLTFLKVFTELSIEECCDYSTLKAALLDAYSVVPEIHRKRFCTLTKSHAETYSEFAFCLNTQFTRWIESEDAHSCHLAPRSYSTRTI